MGAGIAVVTSGFPRRSETFLLHELLALEARGELAAIVATKPGEAMRHPGCARLLSRVHVLPAGSAAAQARQAADLLRARPVRAVHGYFAHRPAAVAAAAAARLGLPFGFSVHARDARKVAPAVLAARAQQAACVVACNHDVAAELRRAGARATLVPHGVDTRRFRPRPLAVDGPCRLLAVGRLVEKKGFDVLVDAVARLRMPVELRIVGEGPEHARLAARIAAHGLGDRITLRGPATHSHLPRAYAWAHMVVVPSIVDASGDRDGLPNVVLEAMASGRAVVASDVGAMRAAVVPGRTGVLVPPGDAMALACALAALARAPRRRAALGRQARQRVCARYDLGRCTARLHHTLAVSYA